LNPPDLKRSAACERVAELTRNPKSRFTWRRMADRWHRCASAFTSATAPLQSRQETLPEPAGDSEGTSGKSARDRVPWRGVAGAGHRAFHRRGPDRSAGDCRKADGGIIAQRCDGFQRHVASALDGPFIVLFEEDAPTRRMMASSLGKMPTTSVRRLISPLRRSIGLVECSLARCWAGKVM
jgi:hypothetical protein